MPSREPRDRGGQDSLRTLVYVPCQTGKKTEKGVEDPPGVANGCCTVGVAAEQLRGQNVRCTGLCPKSGSSIVGWAPQLHGQPEQKRRTAVRRSRKVFTYFPDPRRACCGKPLARGQAWPGSKHS